MAVVSSAVKQVRQRLSKAGPPGLVYEVEVVAQHGGAGSRRTALFELPLAAAPAAVGARSAPRTASQLRQKSHPIQTHLSSSALSPTQIDDCSGAAAAAGH